MTGIILLGCIWLLSFIITHMDKRPHTQWRNGYICGMLGALLAMTALAYFIHQNQ